jgi:23S rRNA (cytidine1920-2'-O)/16S rRNA (cytidine1409-2'-O)-methyltransferase
LVYQYGRVYYAEKGIENIKKKNKITEILLEKGLADTEKEARAILMEGRVRVAGRIIEKSGTMIDTCSKIKVTPQEPYVSRGGLKLEGAFKDLGLSISGKKAVDIGSSTGGFTDFLLQNGAAKIIDIDVGYGGLSWKLRNSPRVTVLERTNVRDLEVKKIPFIPDFAVVDVSFISIKKIFEKVLEITSKNGEILILIKPQFELKKDEVENKGIIKNRYLHYKVLKEIKDFIVEYPVKIKNFTFSKIKGAKGNIEFWIFLVKCFKGAKYIKNYDKIIREVVEKAHVYFNQKKV